jgi:hypothetical protein
MTGTPSLSAGVIHLDGRQVPIPKWATHVRTRTDWLPGHAGPEAPVVEFGYDLKGHGGIVWYPEGESPRLSEDGTPIVLSSKADPLLFAHSRTGDEDATAPQPVGGEWRIDLGPLPERDEGLEEPEPKPIDILFGFEEVAEPAPVPQPAFDDALAILGDAYRGRVEMLVSKSAPWDLDTAAIDLCDRFEDGPEPRGLLEALEWKPDMEAQPRPLLDAKQTARLESMTSASRPWWRFW